MSEQLSDRETRHRRILYRASHRGTKELDWLLGRFADKKIDGFGEDEMAAFERFLALPDPDIQEWLLNPDAPEPNGEAREIVRRIKAFHDI